MSRAGVIVAVGLVMALGHAPGALAQVDLDDTVDQTQDAVQDTVDQVEDTAGGVVGGAGGAVGDAGGTVGGSDGGSGGTVQDTISGTASEPSGEVTGTQEAGSPSADTGSGSGAAPGQRARGAVAQRGGPEGRGAADGADRMDRLTVEATLASVDALAFVPLTVRLTNDADGDGVYSDLETAEAAGGAVSFQVVLENDGAGELEILAIREVSTTDAQSRSVCPHLAGRRLASGESVSCRFTIPAPAGPGERVVRIAEVDVVDIADPNASSTVTDTSVVEGPAEGLGLFIRALASTGAQIGLLLLIAAALGGAGAPSIWIGSRRARPRNGPGPARLDPPPPRAEPLAQREPASSGARVSAPT